MVAVEVQFRWYAPGVTLMIARNVLAIEME
jgi:hypothetical protein